MTEERERISTPDRRRGKVGNLYFEALVPPEIIHKEAVLFVLGTGMNYRSGLSIAEFFARPENGYRALTFSLRGHEGSEMEDSEFAKTTPDDYLRDVGTMSSYLNQEFGVDSKDQIVMGHSSGGLWAMKHAEQSGAKALILLSSALPKELIEKFGPEVVYPKINTAKLASMRQEVKEGKIYTKPRSRLKEYFSDLPPDFDTAFDEKYAPLISPEAPIPHLETYINPPSIESAKIKCPTLVIGGTKDVIDPRFFRELAGYLGADYREYLVGHAMMFERTWPEIAQEIKEWLEKNIK